MIFEGSLSASQRAVLFGSLLSGAGQLVQDHGHGLPRLVLRSPSLAYLVWKSVELHPLTPNLPVRQSVKLWHLYGQYAPGLLPYLLLQGAQRDAVDLPAIVADKAQQELLLAVWGVDTLLLGGDMQRWQC